MTTLVGYLMLFIIMFLLMRSKMMPLYRRLKISPYSLLLITGCAIGVMNLVPWGGPIVRVAQMLEMDVTERWHIMLPFQVIALVATLAVAAICGVAEKKRRTGQFSQEELSEMQSTQIDAEAAALRRPKLFLFNILLTIILYRLPVPFRYAHPCVLHDCVWHRNHGELPRIDASAEAL